MLKIRWEPQAWLSGAWTTPFQALTENGLASVATGMGAEPLSEVPASRDPRVMGGEGREASGWRSLFQIVLVLGSHPEQSVILGMHPGRRGVGRGCKSEVGVPAASDKSQPLGWETRNYTSGS